MVEQPLSRLPGLGTEDGDRGDGAVVLRRDGSEVRVRLTGQGQRSGSQVRVESEVRVTV